MEGWPPCYSLIFLTSVSTLSVFLVVLITGRLLLMFTAAPLGPGTVLGTAIGAMLKGYIFHHLSPWDKASSGACL